ncbi:MAG TPA: response regulator [Candidatus Binatia bacterium]|jgi:PleD family two-component response regulator
MGVSADRVRHDQGQMKAADSLQPQERKPTILVVDDNKTVLEFLLLLLSKHGLSVIGTSSGSECLHL